jgi:protein-tyrosine-phosphatase
MKKRVLILCTGNSVRSQMAEGLLKHDAGDRFEVESAGTKPGRVRLEAIAVMKELGIDISGIVRSTWMNSKTTRSTTCSQFATTQRKVALRFLVMSNASTKRLKTRPLFKAQKKSA